MLFQKKKDSLDVVTSMIKVFNFDYTLLYPRVSPYFVIPYASMNFDVLLEKSLESFSIFKFVSESILAEKV